jgi:hypothetical protein
VGRIRFVATEAPGILISNGRDAVVIEVNDTGRLVSFGLDVRPTRAVARLALVLAMPKRAAGIRRARVLGAKESEDRRVVVASETGVRTLLAVRGRRCFFGIGNRRRHPGR